MSKKNIPRLLVVFDSNVLYTQVASDLLRNEVQRIIEDNSSHTDLLVEWYIPDIVLRERRYQMLSKAKELLPNLSKLERLLGHSFGVGDSTLELHVDDAINKSVKKHNIKIATCNASNVDWNDLILRSVNRSAPFDNGEKEKGFRDAVIAQSFFQLQESSPATPNICRLAIVSNDTRLQEYLIERTSSAKNIRILSSLDELESLINTLASTIPEEFSAELTKKAEKIFFEKENQKTFYYKEEIRDKIKEQYASDLEKTILEGASRGSGTWWISPPIFIKKERQKIYWASSVQPEFEIYHYEREDQPPTNGLLRLSELASQASTREIAARTGLGLLGSTPPSKKVVDLKGKEKFEVHWSTTLSQAQNLTSPKLEKIVYLGNDLGE